jgi:ATP-dependent helicase/DNAse subunit B
MRLIRGAPGSGKTALVFRGFAEAVRQGRARPRIVVPTATLVRHYQHELARSGLVFDPGMVVSLIRFAQECVPELRQAPEGLLRALTRDALSRLQLPEFAQIASAPGLGDVILETIELFENADCTPERLSRVRNLSAHGKAFLRVWKEVDAAIATRSFVTRAQILRHAASNVPKGDVWMDGFLNLSPLERTLARAIALNANLTMTLTHGPVTGALHRFAIDLGASDRLLTGPSRHPRTTTVEAPSPEREADEIARRILQLRSEGVEFSAMAVALRDVATWLPLLRITFDRFGIPARYYFSTPARSHPVAAFLGGLLTSAIGGWDFSPTVAALRTNPAWGASADFDRFDFRVREAMPARGADKLLALCESDRLRSNVAGCLKVETWCSERARPGVWQKRLEQFAVSVYRLRTVAEPVDYAAIETARSHSAGLRAWSAALDTTASFFAGDESVPFDRFCKAVIDALDDAVMQIPDDRQNVVHVMSAFEARQWEVRALFVCGMTARDYPRHRPQNLIFPDGDIDRLRSAGIPLLTAAEADRDEELLFESLKARASERLILTTSTRDSGVRTAVPSAHFQAVANREKSRNCHPAPKCAPAIAGIPDLVSEELRASLAARHRTIRLTALENLLKCRFRFYADRTLELKEAPERPADRIAHRATGLIFHGAMEDWLTDRTRDFVPLFEKAFEEYSRKNNLPRGYRLEVERIESRRIARKVAGSVDWPLESCELEVDCSLDFPGGVTVTCRVDRIDRIGDGNCVIVDYKSGKVANVDKLLESETSLQGPLYALAVREKMNLNPVAMVFLAIREDKKIGWGAIPGSGLELEPMPADWIDSARIRTETRLAGFLAGDVHPEPSSRDDCKWCDFKETCRVEQREMERVKIAKIGVAGVS